MDLIARLHRLLLEVEKDLGEPRLLLRQGKDRFIDDLKAQGRADTLASRVGYAEADARLGARLVGLRVAGGLDLQLIGGLHEDEAMVADRLRVCSE